MKINIQIEQLILQRIDLPRHQQPRLQTALEQELSRLLLEHGLPPHLQAGGSIPALQTHLTDSRGASPVKLGRQIAQSIYRELTDIPSDPV